MSYQTRQPYPAVPPGWAPIPYQGAPPPMPQGYAINQQQWSMGQWQPNPHYNPTRYPAPSVPWMPSHNWQQIDPRIRQRQQQQANFNPYKKVVKPPSAEYLAMPLSDNPLGLHNMVEAENRYQDEAKEPQTPWLWNPLTLSNDGASLSKRSQNETSTTASNAPSRHSSVPTVSSSSSASSTTQLVRHATEPNISTEPSRESFTTEVELRPTFSSKIVRTPDHYTGRSPLSRHNSASGANSICNLSARVERMSTSDSTRSPPLQDDSHSRQGSIHSAYTVTSDSVSGVPNLCDEPGNIAGITSSSARPIPRSRGSHGESAAGIGSASTLHTIIEDTPPRRRRSHKKEPSGNELDIARSPPRAAVEAYPHQQKHLHHHDPPGQQHTPPETFPTPRKSSYPPADSGACLVSPTPSTASSIRIYAPPPENQHPLPIPARMGSGGGDGGHRPRPSLDWDAQSPLAASANASAGSTTSARNKLPTPPLPVSFNPHPGILPSPTSPPRASASPPSSASSAGASMHTMVMPTPLSPPPTQSPGRPPRLSYVPMQIPPGAQTMTKSVRKGFWNRRGDHLTHDGYVVYALPDLSYPEDLRDYPDGKQGYRDEFGRIAEWDEQRPELEASLPVRGGKPERPYRSFIVFVSKDVIVAKKERDRTSTPGESAPSRY